MSRYDPEIIAALAEGRLDPQEAEALEREIGTDPVASESLAAQRMALAAMRQAPVPLLTAAERTDLRRRIADDLGLAPVAAPTPPPRRIAWGSIGVAAAALVGVVAIVPVVGLLTTSSDGDAAAVSIDEATSEATARAGTAPTGAATPEASGETVTALDSATTTGAPATTADGDTATTAAGDEPTTTTGSATSDAPPGTTETQERDRAAWLSGWRDSSADPEAAADAEPATPCYETAGEHLPVEESAVQVAAFEGSDAVAFYLVEESGDVGAIAAFVTETCELIAALE